MLSEDEKRSVERRLGRVAGQVAGVQRMIQDDRYCMDVLHQIAAVRAALSKVSAVVLRSHLHTCVRTAFHSDDEQLREARIDELVELFDKQCKR